MLACFHSFGKVLVAKEILNIYTLVAQPLIRLFHVSPLGGCMVSGPGDLFVFNF